MSVFLTSMASSVLSNLSPSESLEHQLLSTGFLVSGTDTNDSILSSQVELDRILGCVGGPTKELKPVGSMLTSQERDLKGKSRLRAAQLTGTAPHIRSMSVEISKLAQGLSWTSCEHIMPIGTFLDSLLLGRIAR